jgi:hypothetical protein
MDEPKDPPLHQCPWCSYADVRFKQVMTHMESMHHDRWCGLVLYPPIAGHGPV